MKKLATIIAAVAAFAASAFDRAEFTAQVLRHGKDLTAQVNELRENKQKHPKYFNFRGTDAQKKAAYAAQLKKYNAWMTAYKPASRDRLILADAYTELKRCSDSRARDIAVEISAIITPSESVDGIYDHWVIRNGTMTNTAESWTGATPIEINFDKDAIAKFQLPIGPAKGQWRRIKFMDGIMHYGTLTKWTQRHPRQSDPFAAR